VKPDALAKLAAASPEQEAEKEELRRALTIVQRQLAKKSAKVDDLVAATIESARAATLAFGPIRPVAIPKPGRSAAGEEHALLVTSDWQGAKVTASYNSDVMETRVRQFVSKCAELTALHRKSGVPVDHATIVFGGDLVEGLFNFPTQPFEIDASLFEQFVRVSRLIVDAVRECLATFQTVTVVPEWGNHGRIGSKRDAVPRADNVDRMCYELARQLLATEPRVIWQECPEDVQRLVIGNYRAVVLHGDEIGRMGFAATSTIVQHINRWKSGAYRVDGQAWPFQDAYTHHYHTHAEWPLADGIGAVYQTGSTESDNRYASVGLASSAMPSQRLHFIDPRKGRVTSQYKVHLD
jgi:hypothetical protein